MDPVVGQTKDVGFEIGVSRTVEHPPEAVWAYLTGADGLAVWLGRGVTLGGAKGEAYRTLDGTEGEIRSVRPMDRVRLTWRPPDWDHDTTVQVVVSGAGEGRSRLNFHQEWLADSAERERQRTHWREVMDHVEQALG